MSLQTQKAYILFYKKLDLQSKGKRNSISPMKNKSNT